MDTREAELVCHPAGNFVVQRLLDSVQDKWGNTLLENVSILQLKIKYFQRAVPAGAGPPGLAAGDRPGARQHGRGAGAGQGSPQARPGPDSRPQQGEPNIFLLFIKYF